MKKIIILMLSICLLCGCNKDNSYKEYNSIIDNLNSKEESTSNIDLDITIEVEKLSEELYNYRALIDKKGNMENIKALLITNKTDDIYPSIGIFDEPINLNDSSISKGIKLSGYTSSVDDISFRLYISYESNKEYKEIYYLVDKVTYIDN